jgi:hypothetical protein
LTTRERILAVALTVSLAGNILTAWHGRHTIVSILRSSAGIGATAPRALLLPPGGVVVTVDIGADVHAISPYIYGIAKRDEPKAAQALGAALDRWGGNPSSRYNWTIGHAWNAADDYEFRNYGSNEAWKGSAADYFVAQARAAGMGSLITIPALGWVAKSDSADDRSLNVPEHGGAAVGPDGRIAGYDPTANRARTSVRSAPSKGSPFDDRPDPASAVVYQDEWVAHLVRQFGAASGGGVPMYSIDNEPMLWSETHRDVHPAAMSYDDLAKTFQSYADAVKAVDPSALILGPESWGWTEIQYSALDAGTDRYATHADRTKHGDVPLAQWFLSQMQRHDQQVGYRTLDVLTVHWYPQAPGVASDASNPALDALRIRSTRSLWDPTYAEESWINDKVELIPRLKRWIDQEYPGTKIGVTEYNFGGGDSMSAGLAEADALGIFGREGVYVASYWTVPKENSPAWMAFRMFRNYDGKGASFGSTSVKAVSSLPDAVSAFASLDASGFADIMLVNSDLTAQRAVEVNLTGMQRPADGAAQVYQYASGKSSSIQALQEVDVTADGSMSVTVPPASITLLRVAVR